MTPGELIVGKPGEGASGLDSLDDDSQICSCNNVTKAQICSAITDQNLTTVGELKSCTKAGTGCGGCLPLVTSLLLVFIAARTGWLPLGSMTSSGASAETWGAWIADVASHLPLPVLALALPLAATFERLQSQALGETLHLPFVLAASARGVSERAAILRHAWPASLRAICAVYGIVIGAVLSGSFVVEYVTAWPGLGRLMYDALKARDIYLVAGCAAMGASLLAAGTLIGDLMLAAADPRVREEAAG